MNRKVHREKRMPGCGGTEKKNRRIELEGEVEGARAKCQVNVSNEQQKTALFPKLERSRNTRYWLEGGSIT